MKFSPLSATESIESTTVSHSEDLLTVVLAPGTAVGIVPGSFLDDVEEGVGVGLVDRDGDGVRLVLNDPMSVKLLQVKNKTNTED